MNKDVLTYIPLAIHIATFMYSVFISVKYIWCTFFKDSANTEPNWNTRYLLIGVLSLMGSLLLPIITMDKFYPPYFISKYCVKLLYNSIQYYAYLFLLLYSVKNIRLAKSIENISTLIIYSTLLIFIYSIPVLLLISGGNPIDNVTESKSFIVTLQQLHIFQSAATVSIVFLLINIAIFIVDIVILIYCTYTRFDVVDKSYYTFYVLVSLKLFGQFYVNSTSLASQNVVVSYISWIIGTGTTIALLVFISRGIIGNGLTVLSKDK